jgi:hypothetical protein
MQKTFSSTPTSPKKADSETGTTNSASLFFNSPVNKYRDQLIPPRLRMQSSDQTMNQQQPAISFHVSSVSSADSHYSSLFSTSELVGSQ